MDLMTSSTLSFSWYGHLLIGAWNSSIQVYSLVERLFLVKIEIMDVASQSCSEANRQFGLKVADL
jgi:hypothetical protein